MKNFFNRILVPVIFSKDTSPILQKAIEIANKFGCDIHLLHVHTGTKIFSFISDGHFSNTSSTSQFQHNERKMEELVEQHRGQLNDGLLMNSSVRPGTWQAVLKDTIITYHIDLLMIPGHPGGNNDPIIKQININRLSQQTQCPVLTITTDFAIGHIQNIVVPVNDFLPVRKLTAATFLSKKFNGMVHLLGQRGDSYPEDKTNTICLTKAYQLLSEYTNVKIHCSSEKGSSVAADVLAYARKVDADLIVVNPGKESVLSGFFNRWLAKYLHRESNIPVLTISPQP